MSPASVLGAIGALLLASCGSDRIAGRPGGDQTENGILARVLDPSGSPVVGARLVAHPASWTATDSAATRTEVGITAWTDASGRALLPLDPGRWRIEILSAGRRAQFGTTVGTGIQDAGSHRLSLPGGLHGIAASPGAWVAVRGLAHAVRADSLGRFHLDSLPAGAIEVVDLGEGRAWATAIPGTTVDCGVLATDSVGQILLEDFEDGDSRHRRAPLTGGGWWYVATSDSVVATPAIGEFWRGILRDSSSGNRHLRVRFDFSSAGANPWAEVGVQLGALTASATDLSRLESLRFGLLGSGTVSVRFNSRLTGRLVAHVVASPSWKEVRIPLDSFRLEGADSATTPRGFLEQSTSLSWEILGTGEIGLDDIRLQGLAATEAWGDLSPP